jgi:hypothetical protein
MKIRADRRVGLLLGGVILATFVALGATVALPAVDPSLDADVTELSAEEQHGQEVFRREGLWRCRAAYARETMADGEGATTPADVAGQNPVMLGLEDVGRPFGDLCGVKLSDEDAAAVEAFLDTRRGA